MRFYEWKKNDVLQINQFGMLEPAVITNHVIPDIMLVPLLSYDNQKNRLGYGGGFYDRYLSKYLKLYNNILSIGIAFSFQKNTKLPVFNNDMKLNYILTEKGIL
jgi:5-formyltetrahydrofolate cyclo-ligase